MIKTKNEIEIVIDPIKKNTYSTYLFGDITSAKWNRGYESISVEYIYFYINEEGVQVIVKEGVTNLVKEQINQLTVNINHTADNKCDSEKLLHYGAFKILMSQNYGIAMNEIEFV